MAESRLNPQINIIDPSGSPTAAVKFDGRLAVTEQNLGELLFQILAELQAQNLILDDVLVALQGGNAVNQPRIPSTG